jgi:RNA polymerase sigma-70 factor, ECF subfamily
MTQPAEEPADLPALLAKVRLGDEAALSRLLVQHEHRMRVAARVLLGSVLRPYLDSIDVVQSVYCALLPGLRAGRYELSSSQDLLRLASGILRRKVARNWRRVRREQAAVTAAAISIAKDVATSQADPAALALANDQLARLTGELKGLDRQLVELRLQGYHTVEIAERLNCSASALRARLSRLRQSFRRRGYEEWL